VLIHKGLGVWGQESFSCVKGSWSGDQAIMLLVHVLRINGSLPVKIGKEFTLRKNGSTMVLKQRHEEFVVFVVIQIV
jgi:hypothetical protein